MAAIHRATLGCYTSGPTTEWRHSNFITPGPQNRARSSKHGLNLAFRFSSWIVETRPEGMRPASLEGKLANRDPNEGCGPPGSFFWPAYAPGLASRGAALPASGSTSDVSLP